MLRHVLFNYFVVLFVAAVKSRSTKANSDEKAEAINVYLAFNLARGHLKAILNAFLFILDNRALNYNFVDLIGRVNEAIDAFLRKTGWFSFPF